jgi:hypothetical protein
MRVVTRQIFLALAIAVGLAGQSARADELEERAAIRDAVTQAWQAGDFDTVERLHTQYSDFLHQRTASGASKMGLLFDGLTEGNDASEEVLKRDIARTERWAQVHPDSPLGYVLHAQALMSYAFHVRGTGYSNTVLAQTWAVFHEYQKRAGKYLVDHQAVASQTTSWHATMINIGRDEGWSPEVMRRIFEDGIARSPADYRLYMYREVTLLPKWNGSIGQVDAFIRDVSARAPAAYGMEMYARLYAAAGEEQFHRDLYSSSLVDWAVMKVGLQAWVNHFPTAWNKNIFAYHACLAGDKAVAKPLFDEIAGRPEWEIWTPNAQVTFEACLRWAADPHAEPTSPPVRDPANSRSAALPAGAAVARAG